MEGAWVLEVQLHEGSWVLEGQEVAVEEHLQ